MLITLMNTGLSSSSNQEPLISNGDFAKMMTSLSNWGRWGKVDKLGALNLITHD